MNLNRMELYARLGIVRVRFPQYVNFMLPLTPGSPFGFKIRATTGASGDARTIERTYYIAGHEATEAALNDAVMRARDAHAEEASRRIRPGGAQVAVANGFPDGAFPGVAFDYEEV